MSAHHSNASSTARKWRLLPIAAALAFVSFAQAQTIAQDTDADGIPDSVELAVGTNPRLKDNDIFESSRLFCMQLFRDTLSREGDTAGVDSWAKQLASGAMTREALTAQFLASGEFQNRVAPVVRLYYAYYNRMPDTDGLFYWMREAQRTSITAVSNAFAAAPEFTSRYGSLDNAAFVNLVYQNVLGRNADTAGLTYWRAELDARRVTRGALMLRFSDSPENVARTRDDVTVIMGYAALVRRVPDPSGFTHWKGVVAQNGGNAGALAAAFIGSSEYRARFLPPAAERFTAAEKDAARLAAQATLGLRRSDVPAMAALGREAWINQQMALPTASHVQYLREAKARYDLEPADQYGNKPKVHEEQTYEAVWQHWLYGNDQLRARVAFALSEIVVISNIAPNLDPWAMSSYMDMLGRNAFGNYRTILKDATLHPAMGYFLDMINNQKEDPAVMRSPNENYARELLQLFSIGLVQLNDDGTVKRDAAGRAIPTFDEDTVKGFAKVFTGWSQGGKDTTNPQRFFDELENWTVPMELWPAHHSIASKKLLNGVVLPAEQGGQKDLDDALNNLFNHPNVGPFVVKQLIQRLVTSNPSPEYMRRVVGVFNNNGQGVRGDMTAVIKAILLDAEARDPAKASDPKFGKQREPVIRFANVLRAFGARAETGRNNIWYLDNPDDSLGQSPLIAPSVFNYFSPFYTRPGTLAQAGLVAPEFQITTELNAVAVGNFFWNLVNQGGYGWGENEMKMNFDEVRGLSRSPALLLDYLDIVFCNGMMSAQTRSTIRDAVEAYRMDETHDRAKAALILTFMSPDFVIQR